MNIPRAVIENWIKSLSRSCTFFACQGSSKPPLQMITCNICRPVWEMKQYLYGLDRKQVKRKMKQYQGIFDCKEEQACTGDKDDKKVCVPSTKL